MSPSRWTSALLLLLCLTAPGWAKDKAAPPPGELAERYYKIGQYEKAVTAFQDAYVADPQPIYLYNMAQAQRLLGRLEEAERLYERFLKEKPEPALRAKAEGFLAEVKKRREPAAPPLPKAPPPEQPAPQPTTPYVAPVPVPARAVPVTPRAEAAPMDPAALLNRLLQALLIPDEEASAQATLLLVHRSLMSNEGDDLRRDVRPYSFKKARAGAANYPLPVRVVQVDPPRPMRFRVTRPGAPPEEEVGSAVSYRIYRPGGIAGNVPIFFPANGGPPRVLGLGSI